MIHSARVRRRFGAVLESCRRLLADLSEGPGTGQTVWSGYEQKSKMSKQDVNKLCTEYEQHLYTFWDRSQAVKKGQPLERLGFFRNAGMVGEEDHLQAARKLRQNAQSG